MTKRNRTILMLTLAAVLIALGVTRGLKAPKKAQPRAQAPAPAVATVAPEPWEVQVTFGGASTLEALEDAVLYSKVTGRVTRVTAHPGERVRKGQLLAVIDYDAQEAQVRASSAQVESARASLQQARASLEEARREMERYRRLFEQGYATRQEMDKRSTALSQAEASYRQAEANLGSASASLSAQRVNRRDYQITSPVDGTVLDDYGIAPGTMAGPSTPLFRVANVRILKATVNLPETELKDLKEGMAATVTCEALGDVTFQGTLKTIYPYVDTSTRTVKAQVWMENPGNLKPGMLARVTFVKGTQRGLKIPVEAAMNGKVFVLEDGKARERAVKPGNERDGMLMVLEGLSASDRVITPFPEGMRDGDPVSHKATQEATKD